MNFSADRLFLPVKILVHAGLFFFNPNLQAQSIKEIRPSVLCVNEEVTIVGKELNRVTRIDYNGVALYLSDGDFTVVNKGTLRFAAPAASATNGEELVTTIIYTGLFGAFPVDREDNLMTINPLPGEPSNPAGSSYCEGTPASSVRVDDPGAGFRIDWYDSSTGGSLLGSGVSYTPTGSGTFYAEVVNISTGCISTLRASATVVHILAPSAPTGSVSSSFCEGDPVSSVSVNNPGTGYRVDWYNASTGGTLLFSGVLYIPAQPGTYYAEMVNTNTGCSSLTREAATVTENPVPSNATHPVNASFCGDDPVPSIRVDDPGNGFSVSWYINSTGGTLASGTVSGNHGEIFTPSNSASASYYAEVMNNQSRCLSHGRTRVSVEKNPSFCTNTDILSFNFDEQDDPSEINNQNHQISIVVPYGISLKNLVANFTLAPGAIAAIDGTIQRSGITHNDFSQPLTYMITAADRITTQEWIVLVDIAPNAATQILSYGFPQQTGPAIIDSRNNSISVEISFFADLTELVANFTLSDGATAKVGGIEQISGVTSNDFSNIVIYSISAQNNISTSKWKVNVTQQDLIDNENPIITYGSLPDEYPVISDSIPTNIVVTDNIGIKRVVFRYKRYQDTKWEEMKISSSDSLFTHFIKEPILGGHGMMYYFKAYDYKDNTDSTEIFNIVLRYDNQNSPIIPDLNYGGAVENYQIISIPVDLEEKNIDRIFDELMPYDIKKWRIFHHSNGITHEFGESLSTIYPSRGYWLIIRNQTDVQIGAGTTNRIENGDGFATTLQPGWNQVGNPYNFEISWDDVIDFNANPNIGRIKLYENGILTESDMVPAFRGGFVFLAGVQSVFLNIPPNSGFYSGRVAVKNNLGLLNPIDGTDWQLPIKVSFGKYTNSLIAIGMHPESIIGFDKKDEPMLPIPHEISGFDLYFTHQGEKYDKLSRDIVGSEDFYIWDFEVKKYGGSGNITLQWDNKHFGNNLYNLVMIDETIDRMIDMRVKDNYTFYASGVHKFMIFYGTEEQLLTKVLPLSVQVGDIYPNPFKDELTILVSLPDHAGIFHLELSLSDLNGKLIQNLSSIPVNPGYHQIRWKIDQPGKIQEGLYFLKILVASEKEKQIIYRKILKY
jgi:hypothetical protein